MLLQLPQSLERNVAIETITQSTNASYAEDRHVPMQLSIQTLENQEVWYVHPGTSIQQPITAKAQKKLIYSFKGKDISSQTKKMVAK